MGDSGTIEIPLKDGDEVSHIIIENKRNLCLLFSVPKI